MQPELLGTVHAGAAVGGCGSSMRSVWRRLLVQRAMEAGKQLDLVAAVAAGDGGCAGRGSLEQLGTDATGSPRRLRGAARDGCGCSLTRGRRA